MPAELENGVELIALLEGLDLPIDVGDYLASAFLGDLADIFGRVVLGLFVKVAHLLHWDADLL